MKTIILSIIYLFITSFSLYSQAGFYSSGHDSLLFDGEGELLSNPTGEPCDSSDCKIKITRKEHAHIIGWRCRWEKGLLCGVKEIEGKVMKREYLNVGDYIRPGDSIVVTGSDPEFSLSWNDGKLFIEEFTVKFRSDQAWVVPKDFCETNKDWDYENGHMRDFYKLFLRSPSLLWIGMKKLVGAPDFQVETERAACGNCRGTKFTVETIGDEDVFKMIEGTMDVWVKKFDDSKVKNSTEELQKLNEDFQSGKISLDEYKKKAEEFAEKYKTVTDPKKFKVTLEAGYMVKVGSEIGEIVPIPPDDDKWWEK